MKHSEGEHPSSSEAEEAARSGLEIVLGQPAVHALAVNQQQVGTFSVVTRDHPQRPREAIPRTPKDIASEDIPGIQKGDVPDIRKEHGKAAQLTSNKPKQVERNKEEDVGKEPESIGSIFATAAPMPPRRILRSPTP